MKVLVIGGMHGNEMLGIELVKRLRANPIENIDAVIANEQAVRQSVRYVDEDLNRSFPGEPNASMEKQRANELTELCKQYDVVFDFHNTTCPDNDCGFVGEGALPILFDVAMQLGLNNVVVANYDCINKYALNCISVEISTDSPRNTPELWRESLARIARSDRIQKYESPKKYRFAYRMTLEDKKYLGLDARELRAFKALPDDLVKAFDLPQGTCPIFINDSFTPYNYGGLLVPLP